MKTVDKLEMIKLLVSNKRHRPMYISACVYYWHIPACVCVGKCSIYIYIYIHMQKFTIGYVCDSTYMHLYGKNCVLLKSMNTFS